MGWLAVCDHDSHWSAPLRDTEADTLITRGSLVIETRLPQLRRLRPLVSYSGGGDWPLHFALQALPDGGLSLVLDQGGEVLHRVVDCADTGRSDILRITYCWDAPAREARLVVERTDQDQIVLLPCPNPRPFLARHMAALMEPGQGRYLSPEVLFVAASSAIEPVGPMPTLAPNIPIATPSGEREAGHLRRGDLVLTPEGLAVPVLQAVHRIVPARGSYAPLNLRAPYFGLRKDIIVASTQKLLIAGSEVEYLFGRETVHLQAGHLRGNASVQPVRAGWFARYVQVLLPGHETLLAAGSQAESLYAGRIRRKPAHLRASIFARFDRSTLPEHAPPAAAPLRAFDAMVLAEHRSA